MKKIIVGLVIALSALAAAQVQVDTKWRCPEGYQGQVLHIYNWISYIGESTIEDFQHLCKVTVVYDTYPSDGDMLTRLRQGNPGYDLVVPSNPIAEVMIKEGMLETLDLSKIPNLVNIGTKFRQLPHDPDNRYTVPYHWGTAGVGYNRDKIQEINSWWDVFSYEGPVSWLEDVRVIMGIAMVMVGYDPNSDNPEEIAKARDFLIENGKNVVYISGDNGQELLVRGEVDIAIEYNGDVALIAYDCNCDTYGFAIPQEGAYFGVDLLAIPKGAPNKALAEVFIDYILDPHVGAAISNYVAYATPNQAALDQGLIDPSMREDPSIYPPQEIMDRLFPISNDPELEVLYNDAWDEVKIALSR